MGLPRPNFSPIRTEISLYFGVGRPNEWRCSYAHATTVITIEPSSKFRIKIHIICIIPPVDTTMTPCNTSAVPPRLVVGHIEVSRSCML
jgi:hypothetical protein